MKKCKCPCGEILKQRAGETASQFAKRIYVDQRHFNRARKLRGWWNSKINLRGRPKDCECNDVKICDKCKLPKLNLHRDGFGITDPNQFCVHGLKWSQERRAFV